MRYVVVHHRLEGEARELLGELAADDCHLHICGKGGAADKRMAAQIPEGASVYLVRARSKLFKHCRVEFSFESFAAAGPALRRAFSSGPPPPAVESLTPSQAFQDASAKCCALILAPGALENADQLAKDRHSFAAAAANLLRKWAETGRAEPHLGAYFKGLNFCRSGRTTYDVEIGGDGAPLGRQSTQWHLKKGDNTSQVHAARIYFVRCELENLSTFVVVVVHVGPHPDDGRTIPVHVDLTKEQLLDLAEFTMVSK
jgi:hypothetical protein